jgi:PhnB protein
MNGMAVNKMYPRLVVSDGARAIDFYVSALGATESARYTSPEGKIVHAELQIGPATIALKDADEFDPAPPTLGGSPVIIALYVDDADAVADAMLAAGATVVFPIHDAEYGERGGRLADPFGHLWMVSQQIEDLTPEEIQQRTDRMFAS